jgi:hypothetical protein
MDSKEQLIQQFQMDFINIMDKIRSDNGLTTSIDFIPELFYPELFYKRYSVLRNIENIVEKYYSPDNTVQFIRDKIFKNYEIYRNCFTEYELMLYNFKFQDDISIIIRE